MAHLKMHKDFIHHTISLWLLQHNRVEGAEGTFFAQEEDDHNCTLDTKFTKQTLRKAELSQDVRLVWNTHNPAQRTALRILRRVPVLHHLEHLLQTQSLDAAGD